MIFPAIFIIMLFVAVILMITLDMTDHTVAALLGASIFLLYLSQIWSYWQPAMIHFWTHEGDITLANEYIAAGSVFNLEAFAILFIRWVDLGTIIVILSLMVITEIARDSGLFQYIAIQALKFSGGSPRKLMAIFTALTFLMSTVLATTALIMAPLTIVACDALEQNPTPHLISNAMAGNAGGITTAIASVPAMLVAGATGYDFAWFAINLLPLGLMLLGVTILINLYLNRRSFITPRPQRIRELMEIDAWNMVEDRGVFYRTAILFVALVIGFVIFGAAGYSFMVALIFALIFVIFSGVPANRLFREVEWTALFFFIGLFILVGGMEEFFVLHIIGDGMKALISGNPVFAVISTIWITGVTSGAVDNIPVTATLIPVLRIVAAELPYVITGPIWASLVAGAVLGGALTPIASAANVLTMTVARKEGRSIKYGRFLMTGAILFFLYLGITTLYMIARLFFLPIGPPPFLAP
jgi:Na+/H+ antiporter NhaD/arsenite permease-like protein